MSELIIKYSQGTPEIFPLGRLRITIGRSARNDLCLPDPFASRVHAEVRREGDFYFLQDLGSANGTFYNGARVEGDVPLTPGSHVRIGETEIEFKDSPSSPQLTATLINDAPTPEQTISFDSSGNRTTSGLLEQIEGARTQPSVEKSAPLPARAAAGSSDLLALISKVGVTLLASATLDETLRQIAELVFDAVPAERCLILMRDEDEETLRVRTAGGRGGRRIEAESVRVSRHIIEETFTRGKSVLTSDAQHDPRFVNSTVTLEGIRSVLAVPLGVGSKIFGIIYADSPQQEVNFTEDHLKVLTTLASVAAIRVENTRLVEQQLEQQRMERELLLAREIQQRFQPTAPPQVAGYELVGISFPCYAIGGDYYDFIPRSEERLVIALGDVSGKGTGAALLMSSLHAAIHAQAAAQQTLIGTISHVNDYLSENIPPNHFVTLFYAELDAQAGALQYINAGHNPPLIVRSSGEVEQLTTGGIPLGINAAADFREGRAQLQPGDALIIYSDGVSETQNPRAEEFGPDRLRDVVKHNLHKTASSLRDCIEAALTKFADGTAAADDITLVIVKRTDGAISVRGNEKQC
ncbi:MAG: SpoIIE family protein phosphatase [Pyrinomonadaceae bacterium]